VTQADDNSRSAAAVTTTTPSNPNADVEAAYVAYRSMVRRLLQAPDPDDPEIARRASGAALDRLQAVLEDLVATGDVARYGPTSSQTILTIDVTGDGATVRACLVDESGRYDATTGEPVEPMKVGTIIDTASLQRIDGVWRVSGLKYPGPDEQWEGASTCTA
jgi:hypothetical protein